ncbi:UNVERIFIED_CONTAM: hypothetical protein FKN15_038156 [Acipenser sinensis]
MVSPPMVHQTFQASPAPPMRPSYQPMQANLMYNGQSGLPMNSVSPQGYERIPFQPDSAASHPLGLGCQPMAYHSLNPGSTSTSPPTAGHPLAHLSHSGQHSPHLQSVGYHCANAGQVSSPTAAHPGLGQPSPQLQPMSYHSSNQRSASSPSPTTPHPMVHSPHSGPSSPQMHPLPYQSPKRRPASSPSPTSANPMVHLAHSGQPSPQAHSPGMAGLSGPNLDIKEESDDGELTFRSIGLQDITLDDGKESSRLKCSVVFVLDVVIRVK